MFGQQAILAAMLRKYVSRKSNLGGSVCSCGAQNTHTRSLTQLAIQKQEVCLDVVGVNRGSELNGATFVEGCCFFLSFAFELKTALNHLTEKSKKGHL